jgi:hypothetical protein
MDVILKHWDRTKFELAVDIVMRPLCSLRHRADPSYIVSKVDKIFITVIVKLLQYGRADFLLNLFGKSNIISINIVA